MRSIERHWAHENAYHLDVSGWRSDVYVARGFSRGSVVVRVPWIDIGGLHWDEFPEKVHELLNVSNLQRDVFARRDTLIYLKDKNNAHVIEGRTELNGGGVGDVLVAVNTRGPQVWGAETTMIASLELPTGREGTLQGSGGIDAGIGAVLVWERGRKRWKAGGGVTYLDRNGDFLGEPRADVYHLFGEVDRPLGRGFLGTIGVRIDGSPLAAVIGGYAGHPATYYRFGIARAIGREGWFGIDMGQELLPQTGVEADFSVHLTFGTTAFGR